MWLFKFPQVSFNLDDLSGVDSDILARFFASLLSGNIEVALLANPYELTITVDNEYDLVVVKEILNNLDIKYSLEKLEDK